MIEYYLKHNPKKVKTNVNNLISEIEKILKIENINIEKTNLKEFPELESKINESQHARISDLLHTLKVNSDNFPFFSKYLKKPQNKKSKKFNFADLFAGCGGLSLGMENAGFQCSFVNEIDPVFCETHYFNNDLSLSNYHVCDINDILAKITSISSEILQFDLVCGGPPCQGFSMANRQKILDDPRNNLYKAYLKFLQHTKPKFFVMENVKGMANKIDEIIDDFDTYLNGEYDIHYSVLNAKDFGVPQNRERFFIIGNRVGVSSLQIFNDIKQESQLIQFSLKDAIENLPPLKPKVEKNSNKSESNEHGYFIDKNQLVENTFTTFINNSKTSDYVFNHKNRFNNDRDIEIFSRLPQGANSLHPAIEDIMPYKSRNHIFKDKYFKLDENKVCKTITSHMKFDCNMYIHPSQPRGLSSREAARVQTFPDSYVFRGSQNNWYAQIGNAVPVKLAEVIGRNIIKHL